MPTRTGIGAYRSVRESTLTGRQLEAHLLLRSADLLQRVIDDWETDGHGARLKDAITRTQMLWSFFQDALAQEDNPLPGDLRRNLLNLSAFIDVRLFETLADPSPDKLEPVIEIHRNLAAGLLTTTAQAAA